MTPNVIAGNKLVIGVCDHSSCSSTVQGIPKMGLDEMGINPTNYCYGVHFFHSIQGTEVTNHVT